MASANITVVGGLGIDHIIVADRLPDRGESYTANSYRKALGGKGGNSATAIYRSCRNKSGQDEADSSRAIDIKVRLVAALGKDDDGDLFERTLRAHGVETDGIRRVDEEPTGTYFVIVEEASRDNWLMFIPGANKTWTAQDFNSVDVLRDGQHELPDLVVCQLEIGVKPIERMLETAGRAGIKILLNPSPAQLILRDRYRYVTHFVVNETEAAIYSGLDLEEVTEASWLPIAQSFLDEGVENVVITLGALGAFYANRECSSHVRAFKVDPVDATGAGDTFTGTYASEYVRQRKMGEPWDIEKAVTRACKASALIICVLRASEGIPWADEIDASTARNDSTTATAEQVTETEAGLDV